MIQKKIPYQEQPIINIDEEVRMANLMRKLMQESDAPYEQYARMGLSYDKETTKEDIIKYREKFEREYSIDKDIENLLKWEKNTKNELTAFINLIKTSDKDKIVKEFKEEIKSRNISLITEEFIEKFVKERVDGERKSMIMYFLNLLSRRK